METPEQLREALVEAIRLKDQAERDRQESELLLKGIQHTLNSETAESMYDGMFEVFGKLIPFQDCFVLQSLEPGHMTCIACAHQHYIDTEWLVGTLFKRVLAGNTLTTFRLEGVPEWSGFTLQGVVRAKSALYCAVPFHQETAILVLTSEKVGGFSKADEALASRFASLTSQTLQSVSTRLLQLEAHQLRLDKENAEAGLLQAEKMASVGQLAAGVAHEINNPVGFLLSNTNALEEYVSDVMALLDVMEPMMSANAPSPESNDCKQVLTKLRALWADLDIDYIREDMMTLLSDNSDGLLRVRDIVQALRTFSRQDTGEWQKADINDGLALTIKMAQNEFKHSAVIESNLQPLPELNCQQGRLNQVWMNLLINAGQALDGNGVISVKSRFQDRCVIIEIKDNGCGISPDVMQRLFEPFFTTKPLGEGTGLGLSISYGIVEQHGGRIEVDSRINEGTRFTVYLPMFDKV